MVRTLLATVLMLWLALSPAAATPPPAPPAPAAPARPPAPADEATTALLAARVEIFSLLVDQGRHREAMAELDALTAIRDLEDDPRAQELLLSAYLEGVEFLIDQGQGPRAEVLGREGMTRFGANQLYRGYFLMSLAELYKRQGDATRALATLREATQLFERARKDTPGP